MSAYIRYQFYLVSKKKYFYITLIFYWLISSILLLLLPALFGQVTSQTFLSVQTILFIILVTLSCCVIVHIAAGIFATSLEDGTELLTLIKPLTRIQIIVSKIIILLSVILLNCCGVMVTLLWGYFAPFNSPRTTSLMIISAGLVTFVTNIIFGALTALLSLLTNRVIASFSSWIFALFLAIFATVQTLAVTSPITSNVSGKNYNNYSDEFYMKSSGIQDSDPDTFIVHALTSDQFNLLKKLQNDFANTNWTKFRFFASFDLIDQWVQTYFLGQLPVYGSDWYDWMRIGGLNLEYCFVPGQILEVPKNQQKLDQNSLSIWQNYFQDHDIATFICNSYDNHGNSQEQLKIFNFYFRAHAVFPGILNANNNNFLVHVPNFYTVFWTIQHQMNYFTHQPLQPVSKIIEKYGQNLFNQKFSSIQQLSESAHSFVLNWANSYDGDLQTWLFNWYGFVYNLLWGYKNKSFNNSEYLVNVGSNKVNLYAVLIETLCSQQKLQLQLENNTLHHQSLQTNKIYIFLPFFASTITANTFFMLYSVHTLIDPRISSVVWVGIGCILLIGIYVFYRRKDFK